MVLVSSILTRTYNVILHQAEEGGFWGEVLELPGCLSQGESIDEFRENIREAIEAIISAEPEQPQLLEDLELTLVEENRIQFVAQGLYRNLMTTSEASETWTASS